MGYGGGDTPLGLRVCYLGASKGEEKEEEGSCKLATHCYKVITDGIARFAKKWKAGSFGQGCLCLASEDEASGYVRMFLGVTHIGRREGRKEEKQDDYNSSITKEKQMRKQQRLGR